ncbi:MAG TPA: MgtC/SapB family protein [Azospirillaceae bacterium]|nr:MgtC/SapB family protein [Azospirillaceae bacterium]
MILEAPPHLLDTSLRLGVATLLGLLLGLDREVRGKPAGLRTHALVSMSSAVTTLVSLEFYHMVRAGEAGDADPIRVVQGIAQAIGFICAGVIIQGRGPHVRNLTTAASIWMAGALGIACGGGFYLIAGLATVLTLVVLVVIGAIEQRLFGKPLDDQPDAAP